MKYLVRLIFYFHEYYDFFCVMNVLTLIHVIADVGLERPADMSPIAWQNPQDFDVAPHGEGGKEEEIIRNLEGISRGIPNYEQFDGVPHAYQRHTAGVSTRVHRLLRQLVREMTCYHEHHVDLTPRLLFPHIF